MIDAKLCRRLQLLSIRQLHPLSHAHIFIIVSDVRSFRLTLFACSPSMPGGATVPELCCAANYFKADARRTTSSKY